LVQACGGEAGGLAVVDPTPPGGSGGIGGSGLESSGGITGTGSIFVNGVRFAIDGAELSIDGAPAEERALAVGMVVTVTAGAVEDDEATASRVQVRTALRGPIATIERSRDDARARISVLGRQLIAERSGTVFAGASLDALAPGDAIAVTAFPLADGALRASRIERISPLDPEADGFLLRGTISSVEGNSFMIGDQQIDATGATFNAIPDNTLTAGQRVLVTGFLDDPWPRATRVTSLSAAEEKPEPGARITLQGAIDPEPGIKVNGLPVATSGAELEPPDLRLLAGTLVEVTGTWDGDELRATSITGRRGVIRLQAQLSAIDPAEGTVTLQFPTGVVELFTDRRSLLDDQRDALPFPGLADLRIGDHVSVEAIQREGQLRLVRLTRRGPQNARIVQAPLSNATGSGSLRLLGLDFDLSSVRFENVLGEAIAADAFFAALGDGALLQLVDDNGDGAVEAASFALPSALANELAFRDPEDERLSVADDTLPEAIATDVADRFPTLAIAAAWRTEAGFEIYLIDGRQLFFDDQERFIDTVKPLATTADEPPGLGDDNPGLGSDNPGLGSDNSGLGSDNPGHGGADTPGAAGD
jgi:hypothetical protein